MLDTSNIHMIKMAAKTKYKGVSLPIELTDEVDLIVEKSPRYSSRADFIREAIDDKLKPIREKQIVLTIDDHVVLETIAQDHWQQYHSFEEAEVVQSIKTEYKLDLAKLRNPVWLEQAVEFVCRQKRN